MRKGIITALAAAVFGAAASAQTPADKVDPFIGTTNFGTTNPGAVTPHGMMSVVPFNVMGSAENLYDKDARWWSTPYEYHNKFFTGFAHGALSGVGCPDMGSLLTMATTGPLKVDYRESGTASAPRPRPRRAPRPNGIRFLSDKDISCSIWARALRTKAARWCAV